MLLRRVLDNALNYTPTGGRIWCTTALRTEEDRRWVTVTIRNEGAGLASDDLPRLFERFYRGQAARNYTVPGVGLSLAICKESLAKVGGRIAAEVTPDPSTAFTLWFVAA